MICPILNDGMTDGATLIYFKCPTEFWQVIIIVRAGNSNKFLHVACMMRLCYLMASLSLSVLASVNVHWVRHFGLFIFTGWLTWFGGSWYGPDSWVHFGRCSLLL